MDCERGSECDVEDLCHRASTVQIRYDEVARSHFRPFGRPQIEAYLKAIEFSALLAPGHLASKGAI
jgi:hypothetical protein